MSMFVFAMVVGYPNCSPGDLVDPHETIAAYLDKLKQKLFRCGEPVEFVGAYSLVYTRKEGLNEHDPDYIALERGDPAIVAKYLTPAARLDPSKTIHDYFGDRVEPLTASVALTWRPEAVSEMQERRKCSDRDVVARAIENTRRKEEMELVDLYWSIVFAEEQESPTAVAPSPWQSFTSWFPQLMTGAETTVDSCDDTKKTT